MRKSALLWFGLVIALLVALGLIVLFSASQANGLRLHKDAYYFIKRQPIFVGLGLAVATMAALFDYRRWRDQPWLIGLIFVAVLALLAAVFLFPKVNGSWRWIRIGKLRLQPAEFAKLTTVMVLAVWLDRAGWRVELFWRGVFAPLCLVGLLAAPILAEPDFGSVFVIGVVTMTIMVVAGTRMRQLLPMCFLGAMVVVGLVLANSNRMARISAFLGGAEDAASERAAYQAEQALVAISNGGLWGVGMGQSMQKHYYLPEAHTDFIFAIGAEELGLIFSIAVFLLYCAFFALAVYIARKASDRFGRYLVVGMAEIIFFQAMINLGVVCKAFPTKGMALPFFSYGGSNMLSAFCAVGIIFSVAIHSYRDGKRALVRKIARNVLARPSHG